MIVAASCQLIGNTFAGRWQLTQPAQQEAAIAAAELQATARRAERELLVSRLLNIRVSVCASESECECVRVKLFKQLSDSISNNQTTNKCERVQPM